MTECYSARCQQDRKLARREFNKWTKNILLQIGLETISKNHFEFDVNLFNQSNDEQIPADFNPNEECLFCHNRREYVGNKKISNRIIPEHHHSPIINDEDENAPLDLSLKSTTNKSPLITSNNRTNIKHRPFYDIKSDIPPMYGQEEFDRFMSEMITSQLEYSSQPFLNLNLFPTSPTIPIPQSQSNKKKSSSSSSSSSSQDVRIAQLAKQMAYERMLQEIDYQRHPTTNKKSKPLPSSSPVLTESIHVNHLLNDVMMRILHEMCAKQQQQQAPTPQPSRKGELLFVKKQNVNNDEQYNFNPKKQHKQVNPSSSSSSSTSSISSNSSAKNKTKSSINYIPKGRSNEILNNNNNSKVAIGNDGKQIRPKRGQYRRYESEQLAKAVAAVLSNEMSVHKAGSYFGVPHSTLEYKVKERNTRGSTIIKTKTETIDDDDDDEKSSKGLNTYLPPSNSNQNESDADDDLEE